MNKRKVTPEQAHRIVDLFLHLKDKRMQTISDIMGFSYQTIALVIDKHINEVPKSYYIYRQSKINSQI